ncbi:hypothetical protein Tco_0305100 [Tanacetum coccineum]
MKSRIKNTLTTKPNRELIHYSLQNPPYIYQWAEKTVPVAEGSSETTIERSQQSTRNRGKAIVTSSAPTYDPETSTYRNDEIVKEKEIGQTHGFNFSHRSRNLTHSTNNNLRTSSNTIELIKIIPPEQTEETGCYWKQEEAGVQLNAKQADWKDDTDDESEEQELEAHYMYMAQL